MRKGNPAKRDVLPDPLYNSKLVTRLINKLMLDGKKGTAQNILYGAFKKIENKTETSNGRIATAINNIMPEVELRCVVFWWSLTSQSTDVSPRKVISGLRWLVNIHAKKRKKHDDRLANEIIDAR